MKRPVRSILFAPANRKDLIGKMPKAQPDIAIACLEDAVAFADKVTARPIAIEAAAQLQAAAPDQRLFLRVNRVGSEWFEDDVRCAVEGVFTGVVLPMIRTAADVETLNSALDALDPNWQESLDVIVGIETGFGLININSILQATRNAIGVYFGAEDFSTDIGAVRTPSNDEVAYGRARVALHAKSYGLNAFDMGTLAYNDDERFRLESRQARALGFTGKVCLAPRQAAIANEEFQPTESEIEWARKVVAEFELTLAGGNAVSALEGTIIEEPIVRRAQALLDVVDS